MYEYTARVFHVVDGDTFDAEVDLGFRCYLKMRFRLFGIDTPEINSGDAAERAAGGKSMNRLKELILGKVLRIATIKDKQEKYGRYLARIYTEEGNDVAVILLTEGLGRIYQ